MTAVKIIAAGSVLAFAATACTTPQSIAMRQPVAVQRGDSFTLLNPAKRGTTASARDGIIAQSLAQHIGGTLATDKPRWLVEYSFSARPAVVVMTEHLNGQKNPVGLPVQNYLIDCRRVTVRLSLRMIDSTTGAAAYQSTVEEQACLSALNDEDAVFTRIANEAISGVTLQ